MDCYGQSYHIQYATLIYQSYHENTVFRNSRYFTLIYMVRSIVQCVEWPTFDLIGNVLIHTAILGDHSNYFHEWRSEDATGSLICSPGPTACMNAAVKTVSQYMQEQLRGRERQSTSL